MRPGERQRPELLLCAKYTSFRFLLRVGRCIARAGPGICPAAGTFSHHKLQTVAHADGKHIQWCAGKRRKKTASDGGRRPHLRRVSLIVCVRRGIVQVRCQRIALRYIFHRHKSEISCTGAETKTTRVRRPMILVRNDEGRRGQSRDMKRMERETGIEPATSSLGSWRSTAELLPLDGF